MQVEGYHGDAFAGESVVSAFWLYTSQPTH